MYEDVWGFCFTQVRSSISCVGKASGIDQISAKFLKDGAPVIAIHVASIINLSIKLDTFPSKCKIEKIKYLFKEGSKAETKNYRPISQFS